METHSSLWAIRCKRRGAHLYLLTVSWVHPVPGKTMGTKKKKTFSFASEQDRFQAKTNTSAPKSRSSIENILVQMSMQLGVIGV